MAPVGGSRLGWLSRGLAVAAWLMLPSLPGFDRLPRPPAASAAAPAVGAQGTTHAITATGRIQVANRFGRSVRVAQRRGGFVQGMRLIPTVSDTSSHISHTRVTT